MASSQRFGWSRSQTPAELVSLLETLGEYYPVTEKQAQCTLSFHRSGKSGSLQVTKSGDKISIEYGSVNAAARGLGLALAGRECSEDTALKTIGIMLDCSRNAVMTVEHFKKWLRELAMMGYNMAMLYTEDTYKLPGEPYFGYMRGPYTADEIKELDAYAKRLGIELVACIQVLGHMEQMLQWGAYSTIKDTERVMLVDEPKTYELIEKMITFWGDVLSSRRIHIGMDETHDLGRGTFMDIHGYERGFDIFNRHLAKVSEMCHKHGLKAMIWSDMYFRLGSKTMHYYDVDTVIPADVKDKIPADVELVYWDYYHRNREFYADWIKRHRELGHEPLMGSGVWTWGKLWCDHEITEGTVRPCLEACRELKVNEVFFTLWGDDGAYCEFDSALAGLCWAADLAFGETGAAENIQKSFSAICGGNYCAHQLASQLDYTLADNDKTKIVASSLLWDDPLLMKYRREIAKLAPEMLSTLESHYDHIAKGLAPFAGEISGGEIRMASQAAALFTDKLHIQDKLIKAYAARDMHALKEIAECGIPVVIKDYREFGQIFRRQWLRRNKKFGLDVIQVRLGAQIARWEEAIAAINDFVEGRTPEIAELQAHEDVASAPVNMNGRWGRWAISSVAYR